MIALQFFCLQRLRDGVYYHRLQPDVLAKTELSQRRRSVYMIVFQLSHPVRKDSDHGMPRLAHLLIASRRLQLWELATNDIRYLL